MARQFDNDVLRALEKWPNVPACYGWLRLDRRGRWLIKDQAISHRRATEFLGRNYAHDERGRWFVQNGPQRAYCNLDYTPWIYRLDGRDRILTHTGRRARELRGLVIDDDGNLLFDTELGIGLLQDRDLGRFIQFLDQQPENTRGMGGVASLLLDIAPDSDSDICIYWNSERVPVCAMRSPDVPAEFGFIGTPLAPEDANSG